MRCGRDNQPNNYDYPCMYYFYSVWRIHLYFLSAHYLFCVTHIPVYYTVCILFYSVWRIHLYFLSVCIISICAIHRLYFCIYCLCIIPIHQCDATNQPTNQPTNRIFQTRSRGADINLVARCMEYGIPYAMHPKSFSHRDWPKPGSIPQGVSGATSLQIIRYSPL
jgi:hypothetical protein